MTFTTLYRANTMSPYSSTVTAENLRTYFREQPSGSPREELLSGLSVLLVDDAPEVLLVVSRMLKKMGAQVQTAERADDALRKLKQSLPDVIISDIAMPEQSGHDLMKKIRSLDMSSGGGTPGIAITAFTGETEKKLSLTSGYQVHLTKPIEPAVLVRAIRSLVVPPSQIPH